MLLIHHHKLYRSHRKLQSAVQGSPDLKHLHLLLHSALQEHFVSSRQLDEIGGNVVQQVTHVSPDLVHPHSAGLLMSGLGTVAWPQIIPAW